MSPAVGCRVCGEPSSLGLCILRSSASQTLHSTVLLPQLSDGRKEGGREGGRKERKYVMYMYM